MRPPEGAYRIVQLNNFLIGFMSEIFDRYAERYDSWFESHPGL